MMQKLKIISFSVRWDWCQGLPGISSWSYAYTLNVYHSPFDPIGWNQSGLPSYRRSNFFPGIFKNFNFSELSFGYLVDHRWANRSSWYGSSWYGCSQLRFVTTTSRIACFIWSTPWSQILKLIGPVYVRRFGPHYSNRPEIIERFNPSDLNPFLSTQPWFYDQIKVQFDLKLQLLKHNHADYPRNPDNNF